MSDTSVQLGGAPPPLPNSWNPIAQTAFPPGTPLIVPAAAADEVAPGRANAIGTSVVVALALTAGTSGARCFARYSGLVTLTQAEWGAVLDTGTLLVPGAVYYLSPTLGKLTRTPPISPNFVEPVGSATSALGLLVNPSYPVVGLIP